MRPRPASRRPTTGPPSARMVADRVDAGGQAHGNLVAELDRIGASGAPVGELIVTDLRALADMPRAAARVRAELGELDPELVRAGGAGRAARRAAPSAPDLGFLGDAS